MKYIKLLSPLLLLVMSNSYGQDFPTSAAIRQLMLQNWASIQDYQVDIKLSVKIPGFRMPSRKIHYLYKAPDKSKVEVKGFAIVPKQGIQPFFTFFKDSVDLQVTGDSVFQGKSVYQVVLADTFMQQIGEIQLLVDQSSGSIYQAKVFHEGHEFFQLNSIYTIVAGIPLPENTEITMQFPPDFKNIQRLGKKPTEMKAFDRTMTDEWIEGSISISFANYELNQGLPDYLFEDEAEETIQD